VSGGHTELIYLKNWLERKKIGQTLDDAVGEAFDKVARMLSLPYPGGPEISALAEMARKNAKLTQTNAELPKFPRPMLHSGDLNFSFSGLKTAVLYYLRDKKDINKFAVAREFEDAVIETLVTKTKNAIEKYDPKTLIIGGGVIANKALRENLMNLEKDFPELKILIPEKSLTTDNATMIAAAGYIEYLRDGENKELKAQGNLSISS
jgi:N6-L-threonylcarbamoyladenine synthase